jgi:hypothetical protein
MLSTGLGKQRKRPSIKSSAIMMYPCFIISSRFSVALQRQTKGSLLVIDTAAVGELGVG